MAPTADDRERVRAALWEQLMQIDGVEADFELIYDGPDINNPDTTFSDEAMFLLEDEMIVWVGTRLMRQWDRQVFGPKKMKVTVRVDIS